MLVVPVPLHRVHLDCPLVSGFVRVGIRNSLPVKGITFILGNDLAGGNVVPAPEVTDVPSVCLDSNDVANFHPEVFSACAVTCAQSAKVIEQVDLADSLLGHALAEERNISEIKRHDARGSNVKSSAGLLESSHSLDLPISRSQIKRMTRL